MTDRPDSILITLSQQTIKDRQGGFRQILEEWKMSDGERMMWHYKAGSAPKQEVVWVYWVIDGRIRWRSRLLEIHKDKWMEFSSRTEPMYAKAWFCLIDFDPIPRSLQIERKGFQGFRYFDSQQIQF